MYNYEDLSLESKNIINKMDESLEMVAKMQYMKMTGQGYLHL